MWDRLTNLVIVPGHAVYTANDFRQPLSDESWALQSFQAGEPPFYMEHMRAGVEAAAADASALLVFSGGQTSALAGPRSEALGYWMLADHFGWFSRPDVRVRTTTEEFARDSFENLLFGVCRFREYVAADPALITVVGWRFKEARFRLHSKTIGVADERFRYIGVNDPSDLNGAVEGERRTLDAFTVDPLGTGEFLSGKRNQRNPFRRQPPYLTS